MENIQCCWTDTNNMARPAKSWMESSNPLPIFPQTSTANWCHQFANLWRICQNSWLWWSGWLWIIWWKSWGFYLFPKKWNLVWHVLSLSRLISVLMFICIMIDQFCQKFFLMFWSNDTMFKFLCFVLCFVSVNAFVLVNIFMIWPKKSLISQRL